MAKKNFGDLTAREILPLAVQLEEEDSRRYSAFGASLQVMVGGALVFCIGILIGSPSATTIFCRISFDGRGWLSTKFALRTKSPWTLPESLRIS
jgi:hypothetical protein